MERSLFTGISGLNVHQQMLDVTANNIANVNTVGYKSSSAVFEDALSQTLSGAGQGSTGGTNQTGGTNANQVGLGVVLAGTNLNFAQGSPQATGVPSNLMINGDGFFAVTKGGEQLYTRAGDFTRDANGHLVTPDGAIVENTAGQPLDLSALLPAADGTPSKYVSYSIAPDGTVNGITPAGATEQIAGQVVGMATFANPNGLQKVGNNCYIVSASSGAATMGAPGSGSMGSLQSGAIEGSNVDLSQELTNLIIAERGFQANSKVITTSDEVLQTLVNLKN